MDSGLKKNLIGIDIADAGDKTLVEQEGLDAAAPALENPKKGGKIKAQGFGAEAAYLRCALRLSGLKKKDKTKFSDIPKPEFFWGFLERDNEMGVLVVRGIPPAEKQLARHLEMEKESQAPA
jgi:hypothetical protein